MSIVHFIRLLVTDNQYFWLLASLVILGDIFLTCVIIHVVPFTEIDFETYMYQVALYQKGERDYSSISGPSGPLVYPAGHVHIHDTLSMVTGGGTNLRLAQHIYGLLYMTSLIVSCAIYRQSAAVPNYWLLLLPLSKRLHSIYVLRMFNDCWASPLALAAVWCFSSRRFSVGSVLFSAALSVKMNILLYFPGLVIILMRSLGPIQTLQQLLVITCVQIAVASPFLLAYPLNYVVNAFDLSRKFLHVWTVNWRFVPEDVFLSQVFARTLLVGHLCTLALFGFTRWSQADGGPWKLLKRCFRRPTNPAGLHPPSSDEIILILFTSNLLGVIFARSLHYQFYSWYAQTLPYLVWKTHYPITVKICILAAIELSWNTFPSTNLSSGALLLAHILLVVGVWDKRLSNEGSATTDG